MILAMALCATCLTQPTTPDVYVVSPPVGTMQTITHIHDGHVDPPTTVVLPPSFLSPKETRDNDDDADE